MRFTNAKILAQRPSHELDRAGETSHTTILDTNLGPEGGDACMQSGKGLTRTC